MNVIFFLFFHHRSEEIWSGYQQKYCQFHFNPDHAKARVNPLTVKGPLGQLKDTDTPGWAMCSSDKHIVAEYAE